MLPRDETKATDDTMRNDTTDGTGVNRRRFLQLGGLVALSGAAAACVNPKPSDQIAQTGTIVPAPSTSVPEFPGKPENDATMLLTAVSLERLAIDTYQTILDKGWLATAANADLAKKLQAKHRVHADTFAREADKLGQDSKGVKANDLVRKALVNDQLDAIAAVSGDKGKAENLALKLALSIEDAPAQLYARAGGQMTTAELRKAVMAIAGTTARQYTAVATVSGDVPVPFSFQHTAPQAVPSDNYIQANAGKAKTAGSTAGTTP